LKTIKKNINFVIIATVFPDYTMQKLIIVLLLGTLLVFFGCTPRHLVIPDTPFTASDRVDLTAIDLYIAPFSVINLSSKDNLGYFGLFKTQFTNYLKAQSSFKNIRFVDNKDQIESSNPYIVMEIQIIPSYTKHRTWILDIPFFYPMCGYWPLTPMWGTVRVDIYARLYGGNDTTINTMRVDAKKGYFVMFYSWYRPSVIEKRLKQCYGDVFNQIARQVKENANNIILAAGNRPVPETENLGLSDKKIQIAVIDLNGIGISNSDALALTNRLISELFLTQRYTILERDRISEILQEQGFQQTGCTSSECLVEMGKLLNVEQIISGSVGKIGTYYTIDLRTIDIQSGRILVAANVDISGGIEEVLTRGMRTAVAKITR
jgi:hypothetical protein